MFPAIVLIALSVLSHTEAAGCRAYLNGNLTQAHTPLFLVASGKRVELLQPSGPFFQWKRGQTALVGCSAKKNVLSNTGTGLANITCIEEQEFAVPGTAKPASLGEIGCTSTISAVIKSLHKTCGNDNAGNLYDIGFDVKDVPFIPYFRVCYNLAKSSTMFSEHQVLGQALSHSQINNNRPSFKLGGVTTTVRMASVYTQRHQRERFTTLLGSSAQASKFINTTSYLAKGHLTPDGDAVLDTWASATYFYINAAPEWQVVNAGNWLRVENAVRKVATHLNDTVQVYTGVYDVLELPDKNGKQVALGLGDDGSVEVPKWLWKVVSHQPTKKAIALITLNNPFASAGVKLLCEDICNQHGWHHSEFQDVRRGYTYCCTVSEARKVIKMIPESIKNEAVLKHP